MGDAVPDAPARRRKRRTVSRRPPDPGKRALIVLGMHRSGTSALTGVLGLAGAGLPAHLMPSTDGNPRGYFESQRLYEIHEELFAAIGTGWNDLSPIPIAWLRSPQALPWVERLAAAVEAEFGDVPLFVVKDPRLCRLVPLWVRVLERLRADPSYVLMVRNPMEVAASLRRAHLLDERKGMLLWLDHVLQAEAHTRGEQRVVVVYEDLLVDWRRVLQRVGAALDLSIADLTRRMEAEIDDFLTRDLRHERADPHALGVRADVVGWVKQVYAWACSAAADEPASCEVLDEVLGAFATAEAAFGPILATEEFERRRQAAAAGDLSRSVEAFRAEVAHRDKELSRVQEEIRAVRGEATERADDAARLREELDRRQRHLDHVVEWMKVVLQWSAQSVGGEPALRSLDGVLRALDAADPAELPALGTIGLELAERSRLAQQREAELREALRTAEARVQAHTAEARRLDGEAARLRADLAIAGERSAALEEAHQADRRAIEAELVRMDSARAATAEELVRTESARAETATELAKVVTELARVAAERANVQAELRRERAAVADRDLYLERLRERVAEVERSLAWRMGRPARMLASLWRR
jgi:hypothetical protein